MKVALTCMLNSNSVVIRLDLILLHNKSIKFKINLYKPIIKIDITILA